MTSADDTREAPRALARFRAPVADAVTVATLFTFLLLAVPSRLVLAGIGSAGGPATLVALAGSIWWIWFHLQRSRAEDVGRRPVRVAVLVFFAAGLASYAAAMLRATPATEVSTADSGMLRLLAWTGIALVANDGIPNGQRLEVLLRRLVIGGGLVALLGLIQFATGDSLVDKVTLPGFISTQDYAGIQVRSTFVRSVATAIHPLEYSAVLTMVLPLALTQGLERRGSLFARWWPATVIAGAAAVAVSRSTVLCLAVGIGVLAIRWAPSVRRWMAAAAAAGAAGVFLVIPGMGGVVLSLFSTITGDSSALSRTDSFALIAEFFRSSPVFGRGFATFLPEYRILDNQLLLTLVEMGVVGLIALLALIVAAMSCTSRARRTGWEGAPWAHALTASMAAGATGLASFDGFGFPQAAGLFFLVVGVCGATWRIAQAERPDQSGITGEQVSFTSSTNAS